MNNKKLDAIQRHNYEAAVRVYADIESKVAVIWAIMALADGKDDEELRSMNRSDEAVYQHIIGKHYEFALNDCQLTRAFTEFALDSKKIEVMYDGWVSLYWDIIPRKFRVCLARDSFGEVWLTGSILPTGTHSAHSCFLVYGRSWDDSLTLQHADLATLAQFANCNRLINTNH